MKRLALALVLVAAAVLLPGAAHAVACSPLNCAASQFSLGNGTLLGFRTASDKPVTVVDLRTGEARWTLPAGVTGGNLLVHQDGATLAWYDATSGLHLYDVALPSPEYSLAGVSQDGTRAVALDTTGPATKIVIVSRTAQRTIALTGRQWQFDALRGDNLFLIKLVSGGYQVRLVHVAAGRLAAKPLKDPHESGTIWGQPFARLSSGDGRFVFTLYVGSNGGAMVHELDLVHARARCVDLPGTGNYGFAASWTMSLSRDGRTLWAASPGYGRVVQIDVQTRAVRSAFRIELAYWNLGVGTSAALSPDGGRLALADSETVAIVDLAAHKVLQRDKGRAIALGYAPDGRLWKLS